MKGLLIAFSMYTKIPMPRVDWDAKSMRHVFLFFPFVGVLLGGLAYGWLVLARWQECNGLLTAAGLVLLPLLVTGGIHLDGFLDTSDALNSYADTEKKLAILKDPHVGAFGVIRCAMLLLAQAGLWAQVIGNSSFWVLAVWGFVMSRVLTGVLALTLPLAKNTGLAHMFTEGADKKPVVRALIFLGVLAVVSLLAWHWQAGLTEELLRAGITAVALLTALLLWFPRMARKQFGGITGDLLGYFLQLAELAVLLAAAGGAVLCG